MSELTETFDGFDVAEEWASAARHQLLDEFGKLAVEEVKRDCPVSDINTPGYVHMIDTIDYEIDDGDGDADLGSVNVFVLKDYASYVNYGTSRMGAQPFFTNGMQRAQDRLDELAMNLETTSPQSLIYDAQVGMDNIGKDTGVNQTGLIMGNSSVQRTGWGGVNGLNGLNGLKRLP